MLEQSILHWHNTTGKIIFNISPLEEQLLLKEIKFSGCRKATLTHFKLCIKLSKQLKSARHLQISSPHLSYYVFVKCWLLTKYMQQWCQKIITAQTTLTIITTQLKCSACCSVKVPSETEYVTYQFVCFKHGSNKIPSVLSFPSPESGKHESK